VNQQRTGTSDVLWIVRSELSHLWISYALTGGMLMIMGVLVATIVETGALGPEASLAGEASFLTDFIMLLVTTLLATTYTSWGSTSEWRNPAERRLAMMRMLPIPVSTLIRSRLSLLLLALAVNVPAFFGAMYLIADVRLSLMAYVAFIAVWVGYALAWSGLTVYLDVVRGSRYLFISTFFTGAATMFLIVLISAILGIQIVRGIAELSSAHGIIIGPAALLFGAAVFAIAGRMTSRDLPRREISV
jgi:hypothetical protein